MNHHRREPERETVSCRNCGADFNLAAQYYYDNLCPSCKHDEEGEDVTNPVVGTCHVCEADVRANEEAYRKRAAPPELRRGEGVLVCPDHRDHRWSPAHE
mgnify:CR=1 FL=1